MCLFVPSGRNFLKKKRLTVRLSVMRVYAMVSGLGTILMGSFLLSVVLMSCRLGLEMFGTFVLSMNVMCVLFVMWVSMFLMWSVTMPLL